MTESSSFTPEIGLRRQVDVYEKQLAYYESSLRYIAKGGPGDPAFYASQVLLEVAKSMTVSLVESDD